MVGCALLGLMLDSKQYDQRRRAQMGFAVVVLPSIAWFCWLCVEQQNFLVNKPAKLDWTSAGWASAYIPFFLMQIWGYLCQTYSACCSLLSSSLGRCWEFGWADEPSSPPRTAHLPYPYSLLARLVLLLLGPEQRSTGWGLPMCGSDRTRCVASFSDPNYSTLVDFLLIPSLLFLPSRLVWDQLPRFEPLHPPRYQLWSALPGNPRASGGRPNRSRVPIPVPGGHA